MGYISNVLGEGRIEEVKLDYSPSSGRQYSLQGTVKAMEPQVKFSELEIAYKSDAINFSAINKSIQMIMSGGFKRFVHKKVSVVKKYMEFFENIGEIGNDITFEELLESIFKDQLIYGNAFVELIFDETDEEIVDLALIDPKKIDYAKTGEKKIVLDKNVKSIGYVIKLESGNFAEGDKIPEKYERIVDLGDEEIFVLSKRICHFKLYPLGDKFYGIGLLEASYKSVIYKKNIEKGQANSIYSRGFSPLVAFVGNERRTATPTDIKGVLKQLKTLNYQRYGSFPDWVKLQSIEMNASDLTTTALKDLRTDQITNLSAPQALVLGSGEDTNRATLSDQRTLWEFTLKDIIKQTMSYFVKYILKPINELNAFGGVPSIDWEELRAENLETTIEFIIKILTSKTSRITEGFRDSLEKELIKLMHLEVDKNKKELINQEPKNKNDKNNVGVSDIQYPKSPNTKKS